jgi:hypothetical protein
VLATPAAETPNQRGPRPRSSAPKLSQKAEKVEKIAATSDWPSKIAHTAVTSWKRPAPTRRLGRIGLCELAGRPIRTIPGARDAIAKKMSPTTSGSPPAPTSTLCGAAARTPVLAPPPVTPRRRSDAPGQAVLSIPPDASGPASGAPAIRPWIRRQLQGNRKCRDLFSDAI